MNRLKVDAMNFLHVGLSFDDFLQISVILGNLWVAAFWDRSDFHRFSQIFTLMFTRPRLKMACRWCWWCTTLRRACGVKLNDWALQLACLGQTMMEG